MPAANESEMMAVAVVPAKVMAVTTMSDEHEVS
jgi:hypothetical protein